MTNCNVNWTKKSQIQLNLKPVEWFVLHLAWLKFQLFTQAVDQANYLHQFITFTCNLLTDKHGFISSHILRTQTQLRTYYLFICLHCLVYIVSCIISNLHIAHRLRNVLHLSCIIIVWSLPTKQDVRLQRECIIKDKQTV